MPGIGALISAVVVGIIRPIVQWFSTYWQGRNAQKVADLEATLRKEREIEDAIDKARIDLHEFVLGPDNRVYRVHRGGPSSPLPDRKEPDAQ